MTVTILMPDPTVHYNAQMVVAADRVVTSTSKSEVLRGVPTASTSGLKSGSSSPRQWGPRIANKDLDEVIW